VLAAQDGAVIGLMHHRAVGQIVERNQVLA